MQNRKCGYVKVLGLCEYWLAKIKEPFTDVSRPGGPSVHVYSSFSFYSSQIRNMGPSKMFARHSQIPHIAESSFSSATLLPDASFVLCGIVRPFCNTPFLKVGDCVKIMPYLSVFYRILRRPVIFRFNPHKPRPPTIKPVDVVHVRSILIAN